jgi:Phage virion morphogenesis family
MPDALTDLQLIIDRLTDLAPANREIELHLRQTHIGAIRRRYSPIDKKPWAKLKPSTVRQKQSKPRSPGATTLEKSLYTRSDRSSVTVGYSSPIAAYQNAGYRVPARTIVSKSKGALYWAGAAHPVAIVRQPAFDVVARPNLGYSEADLKEFEKIIERHLGVRR